MNIQISRWALAWMGILWLTISAAAQTIESVYYFTNLPFTASPENSLAGLTLGKDGNFYGTTEYGGTHGFGTIFKVTSGGALTILTSFDAVNIGGAPVAGLTQGPDGNFYGTTSFSGPRGGGQYL